MCPLFTFDARVFFYGDIYAFFGETDMVNAVDRIFYLDGESACACRVIALLIVRRCALLHRRNCHVVVAKTSTMWLRLLLCCQNRGIYLTSTRTADRLCAFALVN